MHDFVHPRERLSVAPRRRATNARPLASRAMARRLGRWALSALRTVAIAAALALVATAASVWVARALRLSDSGAFACPSPAEHGVHVRLREPLRSRPSVWRGARSGTLPEKTQLPRATATRDAAPAAPPPLSIAANRFSGDRGCRVPRPGLDSARRGALDAFTDGLAPRNEPLRPRAPKI